MPIRKYKPTTPGRRGGSVNLHSEVTKRAPEKSLLRPMKKNGGRNNQGKITVQGRGGGHKRRYRVIDFRRTKLDVKGTVVGIEYDPNRSAHIALIQYEDGDKRYILSPKGLTVGATVVSTDAVVDPTPGVCMPLSCIPTGQTVHNIEFEPGKGGKLCRSAGSGARLTNKEGRWATIVLPSGEIRQVSIECRATVGAIGNSDHGLVKLVAIVGLAGVLRRVALQRITMTIRLVVVTVSQRVAVSRQALRARSPRVAERGIETSGQTTEFSVAVVASVTAS